MFPLVWRCGNFKFFGIPRVASKTKVIFFCNYWLFQIQPLTLSLALKLVLAAVSVTSYLLFHDCEKAKKLDLGDVCWFLSSLIMWSILDAISLT